MIRTATISLVCLTFTSAAQAQGLGFIPGFGTERTDEPQCIVRGPVSDQFRANDFGNETIGGASVITDTRRNFIFGDRVSHAVRTYEAGEESVTSPQQDNASAVRSANDFCDDLARRHAGAQVLSLSRR